MTQQPRFIGIDRLDGQERAACEIAVRVLDAVEAKAWDVDGRQRAVEAILTLQGGRTAAFEVTNLGTESALEIARLLAKDGHRWSAPGQWFWSIEVAPSSDRRRLKKCYEKSS